MNTKRRVIRKIGNSFYLKLDPSDVRDYNLEAGDEIDISPSLTYEDTTKPKVSISSSTHDQNTPSEQPSLPTKQEVQLQQQSQQSTNSWHPPQDIENTNSDDENHNPTNNSTNIIN